MEVLASHHRQLTDWAATCPENFADRAALVGAEVARLEGSELEAERLYAQSIRFARTNGFIHNEALAYELASSFYANRGLDDIAEMHMSKARNGYLRWGADGKVRQLEASHPDRYADAHRNRTGRRPAWRFGYLAGRRVALRGGRQHSQRHNYRRAAK
jgi:hypothetical protein